MGEPFDDDDVAVAHEPGDGVAHGHHLRSAFGHQLSAHPAEG